MLGNGGTLFRTGYGSLLYKIQLYKSIIYLSLDVNGIPRNSSFSAFIKRIKLLHILLVKVEPEHVHIRLDPARRIALRQRYESFLNTPSNEDLTNIDTVLLGKGDDERVVVFRGADDGAVGLGRGGIC